jgi:hypothetical protein
MATEVIPLAVTLSSSASCFLSLKKVEIDLRYRDIHQGTRFFRIRFCADDVPIGLLVLAKRRVTSNR